MLKRSLIILSFVALFVMLAEPRRTTNSMLMTEAEIAALDAAAANAVEDAAKSEGGGNAFVRALKAPFKAIGRLFGGGKKKDDNKFHRLSEKDVKEFKSAPSPRLINVTNVDQPTTAGEIDGGGDAKTHLERGRSFLNKGQLNDAIAEPNGQIHAIDSRFGNESIDTVEEIYRVTIDLEFDKVISK